MLCLPDALLCLGILTLTSRKCWILVLVEIGIHAFSLLPSERCSVEATGLGPDSDPDVILFVLCCFLLSNAEQLMAQNCRRNN